MAEPSPQPVPTAVRARSFGAVAEEYDRARPTYPAEAIHWALGADEPRDVVDLGAGTGKLTQALLRAGHRVTAVEPSEGMRSVLVRRFGERVTALTASAEATGLPDRSADAVVAGAAFHWFDHARAVREAARILRGGGVLALLGSRFDRSLDWVQSYRSILGEGRLGRPGHWPEPEAFAPLFTDVEDREFPFVHHLDGDGLLDLALSRSSVATLPADEREAVFSQIRDLLDTHPDLRDRDTFELPYRALVRRAVLATPAEA